MTEEQNFWNEWERMEHLFISFLFRFHFHLNEIGSERSVKSIKLSDGRQHTRTQPFMLPFSSRLKFRYYFSKYLCTFELPFFTLEFITHADAKYWHNFEMRKVIIPFKCIRFTMFKNSTAKFLFDVFERLPWAHHPNKYYMNFPRKFDGSNRSGHSTPWCAFFSSFRISTFLSSSRSGYWMPASQHCMERNGTGKPTIADYQSELLIEFMLFSQWMPWMHSAMNTFKFTYGFTFELLNF